MGADLCCKSSSCRGSASRGRCQLSPSSLVPQWLLPSSAAEPQEGNAKWVLLRTPRQRGLRRRAGRVPGSRPRPSRVLLGRLGTRSLLTAGLSPLPAGSSQPCGATVTAERGSAEFCPGANGSGRCKSDTETASPRQTRAASWAYSRSRSGLAAAEGCSEPTPSSHVQPPCLTARSRWKCGGHGPGAWARRLGLVGDGVAWLTAFSSRSSCIIYEELPP